MTSDPSRRPSAAKVRLPAADTMVWIECRSCLGDGWHYPMGGAFDRARKSRKITCLACDGRGRREILALYRQPGDRIVRSAA